MLSAYRLAWRQRVVDICTLTPMIDNVVLGVLEAGSHEGFPAWGVGLIVLGALIAGLLFVLHIGQSRPHS